MQYENQTQNTPELCAVHASLWVRKLARDRKHVQVVEKSTKSSGQEKSPTRNSSTKRAWKTQSQERAEDGSAMYSKRKATPLKKTQKKQQSAGHLKGRGKEGGRKQHNAEQLRQRWKILVTAGAPSNDWPRTRTGLCGRASLLGHIWGNMERLAKDRTVWRSFVAGSQLGHHGEIGQGQDCVESC